MSPSISHSELTMQYFLQLQAEHSALTSQIDAHRASALDSCFTAAPPSTSASPATTTSSPTTYTAPCPLPALSRNHSRSSRCSSLNASVGIGMGMGVWLWATDELDVQAEERRLSDVNEDIKRTLTELLNCDDVRKDSNRRMWVQSRLMETERELRSGRRRRSAASSET
ncbi:hypothetical protein Cpir12675_006175 [Ceratocystis pirilliformis]|uniref:Uncharacterized protein n=1 Tax=Ceratocystis pirilliformis TaxID=259994 RepID=A0ABR3YKV0_9PEZI